VVDALDVSRGIPVALRGQSQAYRDPRKFTRVTPEQPLGTVSGKLVAPRDEVPDLVAVLDALVELATLAHATVTNEDAGLFDFEVEGLHDLVELAARVGRRRRRAREVARRAVMHLELTDIYSRLAAAWSGCVPSRRPLTTSLTKQQQTAVASARALLLDFVRRHGLDDALTEKLVVHGPYIKWMQGGARTAEERLRRILDGQAMSAAGALLKSRSHVSGFYVHRALEEPFGPDQGGQAQLTESVDYMGWFWARVREYQDLAKRSQDVGLLPAELARSGMNFERAVRSTEKGGAPHNLKLHAQVAELKDHYFRTGASADAVTEARPRS
jgi:hypothetical protein